ncbi:ydhE [Symbiodinium sp. KB8]|nr:ydhE [Symbiodinium sp. KB8]
MANESPIRFAFAFGMASGHINPSLPIARALVKLGHEVHYLSREQMRAPIEDTGAHFTNELEECPELYEGRKEDLFGATEALKLEHGLEEDPMMLSWVKLAPISLELGLPGVLRWMQRLQPQVLVFCPMLNRDAFFAAKILGIPRVPLLTTAGPGSMVSVINQFLSWSGLSMPEIIERARKFPASAEAIRRLADMGVNYEAELELSAKSPGAIGCMVHSPITVVTTCEDMQDPVPPELEAAYSSQGAKFVYVGPLLDQQGARRAAGHKFAQFAHSDTEKAGDSPKDVLEELRDARDAGRLIVLASMGTVITGDSPDFGWAVKPVESQRQGLTGKQLCQAAWSGVFDAFGAKEGDLLEKTPLILVSVGPQKDALDSVKVPPNAICKPVLPQVDLLRAGVDIFLTHGGQNSFMESLAAGVPVVVCPGFADQPANAQKAAELQVGLQVTRPVPAEGEEDAATASYTTSVAEALRRVQQEPVFRTAAAECGRKITEAGGVQRTVDILLQTGRERWKPNDRGGVDYNVDSAVTGPGSVNFATVTEKFTLNSNTFALYNCMNVMRYTIEETIVKVAHMAPAAQSTASDHDLGETAPAVFYQYLIKHANGSLMAQTSQYRLPETDINFTSFIPGSLQTDVFAMAKRQGRWEGTGWRDCRTPQKGWNISFPEKKGDNLVAIATVQDLQVAALAVLTLLAWREETVGSDGFEHAGQFSMYWSLPLGMSAGYGKHGQMTCSCDTAPSRAPWLAASAPCNPCLERILRRRRRSRRALLCSPGTSCWPATGPRHLFRPATELTSLGGRLQS